MISIVLAVAASFIAPPAGVLPDPNVEQIELRVDYGDLNLGTPAGRTEFMRRVRHAQSTACDREPGPKTQSAWQQVFTCKERARVEASRAIERANEAVAVASSARPAPDL
jgi:UrcA family protein